MSLRVWLPLTKDLRNQGLDDVTVTNNGATFDANGKLGGCYSFDGNDDYISLTGECLYNIIKGGTNSFSISFWIYQADSTRAIIFGDYGLAGGIGFNIELTASHIVRFYWNGSPDLNISQINVGTATWSHVVLVYDTTHLYGYLNGNLIYTYTGTLVVKNKTSGSYYLGRDRRTGTTALNGKLNDVRIYDHALSPLEIKHISQGLILHYPLNRGGWGNNNILINSNFDLRYTQSSGWDTEKNGTQLANSWGGYNSGVSNPSTVYHAHLKELNGEWVYEYIKTANETWLGISQGGLNSKLTAGKTYTFSWEQYCVSGSNYVQTGLYYFKTGATSANFHLGLIYGNVDRELGKWQKFSRTFIAPEDGDYSKNMSWYIYGYSGNGIVYVRHPKLEEGNTATPWSPSPLDTLATTLGLNDNIEYDTSGYSNNGTRIGTFSWTSDTPKYTISTKFNGAEVIVVPFTCGSISEAVTVACWGYESNWNVSTAERLIGAATNSSGWCIGDYGSENTLFAFYANGGYNGASGFKQLSSGWHHFVITFDGFNLIYYVDG